MGKLEIKKCSCGCRHFCAVEKVHNGAGAVTLVPEMIQKYKKTLVVADENTYSAFEFAGGKIDGTAITKAIFPAIPILVPDEAAIATVEKTLDEQTEAIVGIGGGTVNDLCKHIAHTHGLYYIYVATAPSMDGYASDGAALILDGMKVTLKARPPHIIICDTNILCNAPIELIRAGVGDILGKFSCLNDWRLAHIIKGEYFCNEIYTRVYNCAKQVADNGQRIVNREPLAIKQLAQALIDVGVEMSYAGSSRPASGSEHHLAHFFEIYSLEHGKQHRPHGIDVGCAAYFTALLREKIIESSTELNFDFCQQSHFKPLEQLLPRAYEGIRQLQDRVGLHGNATGNYDMTQIKGVLKQAPTAAETAKMLAAAGLAPNSLIDFYSKETVINALRYGKELKDRFTVLWLYEYLGWEFTEL